MSTLDRDAESIGSRAGLPLRSFDDWVHLIGGPQRLSDPGRPPVAQPLPQADALPFQPTVRGPMALLRIVDDGSEDGELVRIRQERCVTEPLDGGMAG